jgi:hypothetical protein
MVKLINVDMMGRWPPIDNIFEVGVFGHESFMEGVNLI